VKGCEWSILLCCACASRNIGGDIAPGRKGELDPQDRMDGYDLITRKSSNSADVWARLQLYLWGPARLPPRKTEHCAGGCRQRVEGQFLLWLRHEQHSSGDFALVQGARLQSTPLSSPRRPSAVPVMLPLLCLSPCLLASISTRGAGCGAMVVSFLLLQRVQVHRACPVLLRFLFWSAFKQN
jgi:hypothetical protein